MYRVLFILEQGFEETITHDWPHVPNLITDLADTNPEPVLGDLITPVANADAPYSSEELVSILKTRRHLYRRAS